MWFVFTGIVKLEAYAQSANSSAQIVTYMWIVVIRIMSASWFFDS